MTDTDDVVVCPDCYVAYVAEPKRCEACGHRFDD